MESDNLRKDLEQQQKLIREMNKEHEKRVETEHQRALECHQASCEITERKVTYFFKMRYNLKWFIID